MSDRPHHNLPVQLSSLVGREAELAAVKRTLADSRLVTLTGVGGAGKSRLALQVASDLLHEYADGAWLIELAPLSEPERVPSAVASGLAISEDRTGHRPRRSQTNCDRDSCCSLSTTANAFWLRAPTFWPAC